MKTAFFVLAAAFSSFSMPVFANSDLQIDAVNSKSSSDVVLGPAKLALAGQFVELMYPASDTIDETRKMLATSLDTFDDSASRARMQASYDNVMAQIEPIMVRNFPKLQQAYASAYADEFSSDELRDLIKFAETATGRHFLKDTNFAENNALVIAASEEMMIEIEPTVREFQKAWCKQSAKQRVAAGDKNAKCSMA